MKQPLPVIERGGVVAVGLATILLSIYATVTFGYTAGIALALIPFIFLFLLLTINRISILLVVIFLLNYFVMGATRYIPLPIAITNLFDLLFALTLTAIAIKQLQSKGHFQNLLNGYTLLSLVWLLYCCINIGNNITGQIHPEAWLKTVRPLAFYPLIVSLIISIHTKHYSFIRHFLLAWGVLTILAAARGYMQKNYGFDSVEYHWVTTRGANTHLIHSGVRYFSFFTDAANFGCSMGLSCITFFLASIYEKRRVIQLFYLITSTAAFYGFLASGTRSAIAVPFAGLALFTILAKNWKLTSFSFLLFICTIGILKFTNIGDNNSMIRRMRTVFDSNDASMNVRIDNQRALKSYMSEAPFGIGIGVSEENISPMNKYYFVSTCPPDSDLVYIWMRTGIVGLSVYLGLHLLIFGCGSFLLLFRVKNPEIRGPLTALLCGSAGLFVASYANQIFFQFPNGPIVYTSLTLVFLGPYFDKQYSDEQQRINP
ncbi:MAG: O-antigen ligase family protein [Phocaeicola sp.]